MKSLYQILTVLFWLVLAIQVVMFVIRLAHVPLPNDGAGAIGAVIGGILGTVLPALIIWVIRHFVGKQIK